MRSLPTAPGAACLRLVQVYYAPRLAFTQAVTFPTLFGGFRLLRCILARERINLVHGHQVPGVGCGLR